MVFGLFGASLLGGASFLVTCFLLGEDLPSSGFVAVFMGLIGGFIAYQPPVLLTKDDVLQALSQRLWRTSEEALKVLLAQKGLSAEERFSLSLPFIRLLRELVTEGRVESRPGMPMFSGQPGEPPREYRLPPVSDDLVVKRRSHSRR